jgi:hypothetical protein
MCRGCMGPYDTQRAIADIMQTCQAMEQRLFIIYGATGKVGAVTQRARRFGEGLLARDLGKTHATKIAQTPQLFRREISAGNSWYADGKIFDFIPVLVCSLLQIRHRRLVLDLSIVIDSNHFLYINRHVTKHFMNIATLIGLHYKVLLKAYFSASGFPSKTHITTPDRPTGAETNIVE